MNIKSKWQSMKRRILDNGLNTILYRVIAQMRCRRRDCIIGTFDLFKTRHIERWWLGSGQWAGAYTEKKPDRSSRCVVSWEDPMDTKLVAPAVCDPTASSRILPLPLITATSLFRSSVSFLLSDVSKKPKIVYGYVANWLHSIDRLLFRPRPKCILLTSPTASSPP